MRKGLEDALASIPQQDVKFDQITSDRVGEHWVDGDHIFCFLPKEFMRPWDDLIPLTLLSKGNLPPFFVRLRTDQAKTLQSYARSNPSVIDMSKLHVFWPHDFWSSGALLVDRSDWGPHWTEKGLSKSARHTPSWIQMPWPKIFTSSSKLMLGEYEEVGAFGHPATRPFNASRQSFPYRNVGFAADGPDGRCAAPKVAPMSSSRQPYVSSEENDMDSDVSAPRKRKRVPVGIDDDQEEEIRIKAEMKDGDKEQAAHTEAGPGISTTDQDQDGHVADTDEEYNWESMTFLEIRRKVEEARSAAKGARLQLHHVKMNAERRQKELEDKIKQQLRDFQSYLQKSQHSRGIFYQQELREQSKQLSQWSADVDSAADSGEPS